VIPAARNVAEPGFAVIYRWRLKPDKEAQFVDAWSRVTDFYVRHHGALGSRLHRGDDRLWYAYAQWPDAASRERAFARGELADAHALMQDAIAERLPAILLEPVAGSLALPPAK
jgi:quinol monooxygenase YgiN